MKRIPFPLRSLVLIYFAASAAASQPKIQMEKTTIDLGAIYLGEIKTAKLVVRNAGDQPLVISNIETSCGCTSAQRNVPAIEPGNRDTIDVSFNSMGFDGKIRKEVMIYSNDPVSKMVYATLSGTVSSELISVPKMHILNFGVSPVGMSATKSLPFQNTSQERIFITGITCADTSVAFQFPMMAVDPSDTVMIQFTYTPQSASLTDQTFIVHTSSIRQPRVPFRFMFAGR